MPTRAAPALVLSIGLGAMLLAVGLSPLGETLEEAVGLPWLFNVRGAIAPPPDVIVVAIDRQSADDLGLHPHPREWPRSHHARLIRELQARGAAAIIFDIKFERPRPLAEDAELASAIGAFGRVLLVQGLERENNPIVGGSGARIIRVPLQSSLAEAALAVAPFPLPRVASRQVSQAWAFHDGAATLPVAALQAGIEERWLALLRASGVAIGTGDADARKMVVSAELMRTLRLAFTNDSAVAQALRRQVAASTQAGAADLSETSESLQALIRVYDGPDQYHLNFYGPPGTVPTVSYVHVFNGDAVADATDFRGKRAFVGASDVDRPVQEDTYPTVFSRADGVDLSGVEIAATAYANLLHDQALRPAGPVLTAAIVFALGVGITLCSLLLPPAAALITAVVAAVGYATVAQMVFNRGELWLPLATPLLLQIPAAILLGFTWQNAFVRRQRQRVQRALGHYVPARIAQSFADRPVEPGMLRETVHATCLAVDAEGFTEIAEGMTPDAAAAFLNAYFEAVAEPLKRQGADLTQFHAHGILCAWTGLHSDPALRLRASLAAMEALDAVDGFNQRHAPLSLGVRLGLHTGRAFVGDAGAAGHFNYGIVGDIANTASRVEQLNERLGTRLLATDDVVSGLDDILVRPLGDFLLAGRRRAVSIVEVVCPVASATMAELSLCARFRAVVEALRDEQWEEARSRLQEIQRDYPEDGPTAYYLEERLPVARGAAAPVGGSPV